MFFDFYNNVLFIFFWFQRQLSFFGFEKLRKSTKFTTFPEFSERTSKNYFPKSNNAIIEDSLSAHG